MGLNRTSLVLLLTLVGCADAWWTADQRGRRLYDDGDYAAAAETFADPMWKGMALYAAKDFKACPEAFKQ